MEDNTSFTKNLSSAQYSEYLCINNESLLIFVDENYLIESSNLVINIYNFLLYLYFDQSYMHMQIFLSNLLRINHNWLLKRYYKDVYRINYVLALIGYNIN